MFTIPSDIEIIIAKYFAGEITPDEIELLESWVKHEENKKLFKKYAQTHSLATHTLMDDNRLHFTKKAIVKTKPKFIYWAAAAAVVIFAFLGVYFVSNFQNDTDNTKKYISIQLGNNKKQFIKSENEQRILDAEGITIAEYSNGIIRFLNSKDDNSSVSLQIPAGKSTHVLLSDGTRIRVNSASYLTFKRNFSDNPERKVTLNGEAYFDVAKDAKHPFYVNTPRFATRVLGTEFNVNSYARDEKNSVILVEGSISVSDFKTKQQTILKPGQALDFSNKINNSKLDNKADDKIRLAWLQDEIYFDNEPISEILHKMERSFNIEIINKVPEINNDRFTGHFKNENLKDILETIKVATNCDYELKGNTVTLLPEKQQKIK